MTKTICDHCGRDVTTVNSGYVEWRYDLVPVAIPNTSMISYGYQEPPSKGQFCSVSCLREWLEDKRE